MITEYKLVELTEEEKEGKTISEQYDIACSKCIAFENEPLCKLLEDCGEISYFIEVELKDN